MGVFDKIKSILGQVDVQQPKVATPRVDSNLLSVQLDSHLTHETIELNDTVSRYNFQNITVIDERKNNLKRYLLKDENCQVALADTKQLLHLIEQTKTTENVDLNFAILDSLNFDIANYNSGHIDFAFLKHSPLTPTGKSAKYPIELYICNLCNENHTLKDRMIHGEISYFQNGDIGKARLFTWYKRTCYTFQIAVKNNNLCVTKIEKADNGEKQVIYALKK